MEKFNYTVEMMEFIKSGCKELNGKELADAFNREFGLNKSRNQIYSVVYHNGFERGENWKSGLRVVNREQLDFIKTELQVSRIVDLPEKFQARFGVKITYKQLLNLIARYGFKSEIAWNLKQSDKKFEPANKLPVGAMRLKNGYLQRKTAMPNVWEYESARVWRANGGVIPEGGKIYYKDGNRMNVDISNLLVMNKLEAAYFRRAYLKEVQEEFKDTFILMTKLNAKAHSLCEQRKNKSARHKANRAKLKAKRSRKNG